MKFEEGNKHVDRIAGEDFRVKVEKKKKEEAKGGIHDNTKGSQFLADSTAP